MTKEDYNRLSLLYQFLTKRFDVSHSYFYDGFYKCFNPNNYGVRDEYLETLKHFTNLSSKDIYTSEHIASHYGDEYLDSKLVKIEDTRICILTELGRILFYLLVDKLKNGIEHYIKLINELKAQYKGLVRTKNDEQIIVMGIYLLDDLQHRFDEIENYNFIFHLFAKTDSGFLILDWNNNVEIKIRKIGALLETIKYFDFSKIEI